VNAIANLWAKSWKGRRWIIPLLLYLGGVSLSIAVALQAGWVLAAWVILTTLAVGSMLLTLLHSNEALTAVVLEQGEVFDKALKGVRRKLLQSTPWEEPIAIPRVSIVTKGREYLAAALIVKDEGSSLREWLAFHSLVGLQHVYLYDNGSTDGTQELLSDFSNFVTRISWSTFVQDGSAQKLAYAHALSNFGPGWRWMAFIDADEFLFPTAADDLATVLSGYEHLPALAAYWHLFGFSGHEKRPSGLVIENFTMRAPFPPEPGAKPRLLKFKSIVDPSRVQAVMTAHMMMLDHGIIGAYTENGVLVPNGEDRSTHACSRQLRLNHYFTKSKEEWERKHSGPSADGYPLAMRQQKIAHRAKLLEMDLIEDKTIHRFLPSLRQAMEKKADSG
jgi:hypothetical protein